MAQAVDLRRAEVGKWRVIKQGEKTGHGQFWICYCVCNPGVTVELHEQALKEAWTRSCGCDYVDRRGCHKQICNWVGRLVGKRLVLSMLPGGRQGMKYCCCCACGTKTDVKASDLVTLHGLQCRSCSKRRVLKSRWYTDTLLVEKPIGTDSHGNLLYDCRFANGSTHIVEGYRIRNGRVQGVGRQPNYGKIIQNADIVLALRQQGFGYKKIARVLGVYPGPIYNFLKKHPEISALAASLPLDEELLSEVPS